MLLILETKDLIKDDQENKGLSEIYLGNKGLSSFSLVRRVAWGRIAKRRLAEIGRQKHAKDSWRLWFIAAPKERRHDAFGSAQGGLWGCAFQKQLSISNSTNFGEITCIG
jgi:hypothetical protein